MFKKLGWLALFTVMMLPVQAFAQSTASQAVIGYLSTSCGSAAPPCFIQYSPTNPVVVTGSSSPSPVCTGVINITQTTTTDVHTFTNIGYICSVILVSATAQSIGLDEGTGTTCETSGTALIGVSSTSAATPTLAAAQNGGFSAVASSPWLKMQASGDHLCVLQSGAGNVSGVITYADHT